jgi:sec-independent protein translocase protein TatA
MPSLGAPELIIIALVVLLLFGATRLPKLGKSMGQSISGFKQGLREGEDDEIVQVQAAQPEKAAEQKVEIVS